MFLAQMKQELNKTETENKDTSFHSTGSSCLDFFALAGAVRSRTETDIKSMFYRAWNEDSLTALKLLFYFRDVRGGQGERRTFRIIFKDLANNYPDVMRKNLILVPEYGRWDDLLELIGTPLQQDMVEIIKSQLSKDLMTDRPSILGKWLPSENTSSPLTVKKARFLINALGETPKAYRKLLTDLRRKIMIVETQMSHNEWTAIAYERVPSRASMLYRKAFGKHDQVRYGEYIKATLSGEKKINTSVLYPYEIYEKVHGNDATLESLWKNLPDYVQKEENALVMADVSGSMIGQPMAVSISLALYFAERNKGKFANHFMTFSESPQLIEVTGNTLYSKFQSIQRSQWGMNTNLGLAFQKILDVAVTNRVPASELPSRLYIISDMQFDQCVRGESTYQTYKRKFEENGYKIPQVVFWNVSARSTQVPSVKGENTVLVSGLSPVLFKQILQNKSAEEVMKDIINAERYSKVVI
jgi:hypothetical protein